MFRALFLLVGAGCVVFGLGHFRVREEGWFWRRAGSSSARRWHGKRRCRQSIVTRKRSHRYEFFFSFLWIKLTTGDKGTPILISNKDEQMSSVQTERLTSTVRGENNSKSRRNSPLLGVSYVWNDATTRWRCEHCCTVQKSIKRSITTLHLNRSVQALHAKLSCDPDGFSLFRSSSWRPKICTWKKISTWKKLMTDPPKWHHDHFARKKMSRAMLILIQNTGPSQDSGLNRSTPARTPVQWDTQRTVSCAECFLLGTQELIWRARIQT